MGFLSRFLLSALICFGGLWAMFYYAAQQQPASIGLAAPTEDEPLSDPAASPEAEEEEIPAEDPEEELAAEPEPEPAPEMEPEQAKEPASPPPPASTPPASGELGHPANANLRINEAGLEIIKESEGLRLEAYNLGGQWLIGYGHSRTARSGMTITEAQATALLREDVRDAEDAVKRYVTVEVNANEFSAMVSLAYNLGSGAFSRTRVVEKLNQGDRQGAADGFLFHNRAGGVPNEHLTHRRELERALFLS